MTKDKVEKDMKLIQAGVIIDGRFLSEFSRLIMIGTQGVAGWDKKNWTKQEKQAYNFARRLIKKYA